MPSFLPNLLAKKLSLIDSLPFLKNVTPRLNRIVATPELKIRRKDQDLALRCLAETEAAIRPDWSEKKAAAFIRSWFADHGVSTYFHRPLVFFGERTRYQNFSDLKHLAPTQKILGDNNVYILDVGPIINGLACDVSITRCIGQVGEYEKATTLLKKIRKELPELVISSKFNGAKVWARVSSEIAEQGYDPIHQSSSYSFFGHRLNGTAGFPFANFLASHGKQTYAEFFLRGLAGQIWSGVRDASLYGLWAVEPHIGFDGYGVKFEEMLVVSPEYTGWLADFDPI